MESDNISEILGIENSKKKPHQKTKISTSKIVRTAGLTGGLITSGAMMGIGYFFYSFVDPKVGETGLFLIMAGILFILGAIIAIFTIISWLFASLYSSLNPKNKKIFRVVFILVILAFILIIPASRVIFGF